jgi:hypothetical protein
VDGNHVGFFEAPGRTAIDILSRKKDPQLRALARQLEQVARGAPG